MTSTTFPRQSRWALLLALTMTQCNSDYEFIPEPVDVDPGEVTECGFTQVEDTDFYAYDCNPVFTTTGEAWAPTVGSTAFHVTSVMGHPFYQLWYTGVPDADTFGDFGLGYAVSSEGTDWEPQPLNPLLSEPSSSAWDGAAMDGMQVVWDPATQQYVLIYQGISTDFTQWGLGVATSPDGSDWTRYPSNPVLDFTAPGGGILGWCWPLGLQIGSVAGYTGFLAGQSNLSGACDAYSIAGSDIGTWNASSSPMLRSGERGEWDDMGFLSLAIADLEGTSYLFYAGFGDWEQHRGYQSSIEQFFGMATSTDGVNWVKEPSPIPLHVAPEGWVSNVAAHTVGSRIHLWVTDDYGDDAYGVGYFLFDPLRELQEDSGAL